MSEPINQESLMVPVTGSAQLHLRRIWCGDTASARPVLMLHGDRDSIIPFALGRELFEQIPEPKTFVAIPGGDHNDAAAPDPAAYWTAIDRFIAGLARRQ